MWVQRRLRLAPRERGFHLITREVVDALPELARITVGTLHVFITHTSASLSLNENASPDVRRDLETWVNRAAPEHGVGWTHTTEGPDDMPAHVKSALFGHAVSVPVSGGRPLLGTWQGITLGEHRDHAGSRELVLTLNGEGTDST